MVLAIRIPGSLIMCSTRRPRSSAFICRLWRDNLDENGASIWMRRGRPSGGIIDADRRLGKSLIDAERQSVFGVLCFIDCRVGWRPAATSLSIERLAAAIALDIHLQDRGVMD